MPEHKTLPGPLVVLLVLIGVSVFINYVDRGNLAIAATSLERELQLNPARLGVLLSAFFWTYAILQPFYGWLVDRWNVYWLFAACFALWSVGTAATGLIHTFVGLFVMRLCVGFGESVSFPSYSKIIALNYPEEHRGVANSVLAIGLSIGPGVGILLGGSLMAALGWRSFFIVLGLGGLLWLPFWIKYMPSERVSPPKSDEAAPSLREFFRLREAWGSCMGLFAGNYINYFLMTWLPYYLMHERHFSLLQMSRIAGAGYLLSAGGASVSGWLSDRWIRSGGTVTRVRKAFTAGGAVSCGLLLAVSAFVPNAKLSLLPLLVGMLFFGVASSNVWAISQTLAGPQAAGRWVGFQNCLGNMAGVVVPMLTGFLVRATGHFYWAFAMLAVVVLIGAFGWVVMIPTIEQVDWAGARTESMAKSAAA